VAISVASCTNATQGEPETIDRRDVPFGLTDADAPGVEGTPTPSGVGTSVFLLDADRLVPVARRVDLPTLVQRVRALLDGPSESEIASGVRTALPSGTSLREIRRRGQRATVDLGGEFDRVGGADRAAAIAQLVYTVTEDPLITRVRFEFEGRPIEVPTDDGELTSRAVGRGDYPVGHVYTRG
jgi:hypothetical protein